MHPEQYKIQYKPVYRLREFERDFGLCKTLIYDEIKAGRLKVFKVGASTRITGEAAMAWREIYCGKAA